MKNKRDRYLFLRLIIYIFLLVMIVYVLYISPYNPHPHSVEDIRVWVLKFGIWAPLIYIGIYTVRPLLFFPTLLLNLSSGILFGPWWGIVFLLLGGFGCATFCYLLGRFGGGRWLLDNFGGSFISKINQYIIENNSFIKMLWLRTVPIFPYDPISILAGSIRLPYKIYASSTLLGMLPGAIAYNLLSDSFGSEGFYLAIILTILAFGLPLFFWWRSNNYSFSGKDKNLEKGCDDSVKE